MQKIENDINPPSERIFIQTWQKLPQHFYLSRVTKELQPGESVPEGWHLVIDRSELNPLGQTPITIEDDPNELFGPPADLTGSTSM